MHRSNSRDKLAELGFDSVIADKRTSRLEKYQNLVLGDGTRWDLLKYELLTSVLGPLPGALGMLLRGRLYRRLFRAMGAAVVIGSNVTLRHPSKIAMGANTVLDDMAVVSARGTHMASITIGSQVLIGRGAHIRVREGTINIGDSSHVGPFSFVGTTQTIEIGTHVLMAALCSIGGAPKNFADPASPIATQGLQERGGVVIGDDVFLGTQVIVNDGVTIGQGSVIGAGSLVTKDIPPYAIAYGVPARVVGDRGKSSERPMTLLEI